MLFSSGRYTRLQCRECDPLPMYVEYPKKYTFRASGLGIFLSSTTYPGRPNTRKWSVGRFLSPNHSALGVAHPGLALHGV